VEVVAVVLQEVVAVEGEAEVGSTSHCY
jgi:hypothetical protein